jgi:hypothetical protein
MHSNKVHLVKRQVEESGRVSLEQIFDLLSLDELDALDARVKQMRESFPCPYQVRDYDEYKHWLEEYWILYMKWFYGADYKAVGITELDGLTRQHAFALIEQSLGGERQMKTAERDAIAGRNGGLIAIIDQITEGLGKLALKNYISFVFFELIPHNDYELRERLAKELINKYGPVLFPGERLQPSWHLAANLEAFIEGFVMHLHGLRKQWRR